MKQEIPEKKPARESLELPGAEFMVTVSAYNMTDFLAFLQGLAIVSGGQTMDISFHVDDEGQFHTTVTIEAYN